MSRKFSLMRIDFKRVDGTGDVVSIPYSPASLVQVSRKQRKAKGALTAYETTLWQIYYCARNAGILPDLVTVTRKTEDEQFDELWSNYSFDQVDLDDDGKPIEEGEDEETEDEENPTGTSS